MNPSKYYTYRIFKNLFWLAFFSCKTDTQSTPNNNNIALYKDEIAEALETLAQHKKTICAEIDSTHRKEIIAVGFPEIIRYNAFQDLIESSANKILYTEGGRELGNFSIGLFQMKPSFVEDLESYISKSASLKGFSSIVINDVSESKTRTERFRRLENTQWQLRYLNAFWHIANNKYGNIKFKNTDEKIRFYATAYNCGFLKPNEMIESKIHKEVFPHGTNYKGKQAAFSDFSVEFYNNYS